MKKTSHGVQAMQGQAMQVQDMQVQKPKGFFTYGCRHIRPKSKDLSDK